MSKANVYTVNERIVDLQSRVLALETENKTLRQWVDGELSTKINDARAILRGQIRDGIDGRDGRDGESIVGPQGIQGLPGKDCTMPTDSELADAVTALRLKLAKWQAAIQFQYELTYGNKHRGLQTAINAVLNKIERDAK